MLNPIKFTSALMLFMAPALSYAFFCPTNFSQIQAGMSPEQVSQLCGKPDTSETKDEKGEGPQEWNYYIPQTVSSDSLEPQSGTLKTQITFDATGKAVNISVNGIGVGSSSICGGTAISLGSTMDQIKSACGSPSFVNKQNGSSEALGTTPPAKKITTFTYNTNPPVKLIFEDGQLKGQ